MEFPFQNDDNSEHAAADANTEKVKPTDLSFVFTMNSLTKVKKRSSIESRRVLSK
jgi:hypothetical protein